MLIPQISFYLLREKSLKSIIFLDYFIFPRFQAYQFHSSMAIKHELFTSYFNFNQNFQFYSKLYSYFQMNLDFIEVTSI